MMKLRKYTPSAPVSCKIQIEEDMTQIDETTLTAIKKFQQAEVNDALIYADIADQIKNEQDAKLLRKLSADEQKHAEFWQEYTGEMPEPQKGKIRWYRFLARFLGYTFVIKLKEKDEDEGVKAYSKLIGIIPGVEELVKDEGEHEYALINSMDELPLQYTGSIVLGLNDALVELSGTLAGLTLAFQNTRMIALSGLITGIAAALSMAASEYLSTKTEKSDKDPIKSAIYTGIAYIVTVALLILPYLVFSNYFVALAIMMTVVFVIIAFFSYYISVVRDENFKKHFFSMAGISVGVALISFVFGYIVKNFIEI
jgi:VIT1/CCC1 family predicted Fe2+/Mn2+ transporter